MFIQNICPAHPCTSPFLPFLKDTKIAHTSTNECQSIKGGQTISFIFSAGRKSTSFWAYSAFAHPQISKLCQSANGKSATFVWLIRKSKIHTFRRWASQLITNQKTFFEYGPILLAWPQTISRIERLVYVKENFNIQSSPQHTFATESFTRELLKGSWIFDLFCKYYIQIYTIESNSSHSIFTVNQ